MPGSASEPALSVAATREEVKKVQIVRWECVNEDAPVAQERLTHRGATYLAFTKPRMTVYGETVLREPGTSPLLTSTKNVPVVDRRASLGTYFSFVKPHIDATFVLVGVTGSLLARMRSGSLPPGRLLGVVAAIAFLSAGAECWTNLVDRDIDAVMRRTARRSLPAGAISVRGASIVGTVLTVAGLGTAASLGMLPFLFLTFALINNVVVYSLLTKRSTPWSIVLGAAVGPLTLWAGYTAISVPMSMAAVLLGAMVAAWVPVHIWAIATRYRDDYARAGVPMAPVVWSSSRLAICLLISTLVMGAFATAGLASIRTPTEAIVGIVALLSVFAAVAAVFLPWHEGLARPLIKLVTAYLVIVLVGAIGLAL
jgi:protoheme IX farnesyltransferase